MSVRVFVCMYVCARARAKGVLIVVLFSDGISNLTAASTSGDDPR